MANHRAFDYNLFSISLCFLFTTDWPEFIIVADIEYTMDEWMDVWMNAGMNGERCKLMEFHVYEQSLCLIFHLVPKYVYLILHPGGYLAST